MKRQKSDNLDRQLSYRLKKALDDDGCADWLEVRERAGMSRTLWHWSQRRVLLVAGVLVLAVGAAGASTGIIPWLGEAAKPIPPTIYPICKASDVQAKLILHQGSGSRELSGSIALINTGDKLCALEGQPKVSLTGADSAQLRIEMFSPVAKLTEADKTLFGSGGADQTLLGRDSEPPNNSAVSFGWQNWCGPDSAGLALDFEIPNGSKFTLPVTKLPACVDPAQPSRLVFGTAHGAPPPVGPNFPLRPKILPENDGEPLVYEQGKAFHYRIALTNTSSSPYRFGDNCPAYLEEASMAPFDPALPLGGGFVYGHYVLNCHSVDQVDPGETVTFAMELPASMRAVDAKGGLGWQLDAAFPEAHPPMAVAPITIVGKAPGYMPADEYSLFATGAREAVFPPLFEKEEVPRVKYRSGPVVPGSRRIVLKKGEPGGPLYAWETESGDFCDATGCAEKEQWSKPIFLFEEGYDSRGKSEIGGFAQDRVRRVDMVVNGEPAPVEVKNNAFYAEFAGGQSVTAVIATLNDGSKVRVKLHSNLGGMVPVG
ncbi:MAG: hypothetical protein WBQ14_11175 [Gaiellaceae bacterium]